MSLVLDTHTAVWYLSGSNELSATARLIIETAERNGDHVFISAISLIEIVYLSELGRIPAVAVDRLEAVLTDATRTLVLAPVDGVVTAALRKIPRQLVPEMPDRIIAATAACLNAELVTRDRRLHASELRSAGVRSVW